MFLFRVICKTGFFCHKKSLVISIPNKLLDGLKKFDTYIIQTI